MNFLQRKYLEMQAQNAVQMHGQFKFIVRDEDGKIRRETPFMDNLILNAGLNRMGTGAAISGCAIGTGGAVPAVTDTSLQIPGAYTTNAVVAALYTANTVSPYYHTTDYTYRFALGSLNGNYTEVGVGWSSTTLFSRALIVDSVGTPTSIPVASNEQLDVVYRLRAYISEADVVSNITISGITYTVTKRASTIGTNSSNSSGAIGSNVAAPMWYGNAYSVAPYSGAIGTITGSPSGTSSTSSGSMATYSNNSYSNTCSTTVPLGNANYAGGIQSILCNSAYLGGFNFQYGFSPPIMKDSTQTLTLAFSASWGRRP